MILGVSNILGPKSHASKIDKTHNNFELKQVLMHNILSQNVQIFSLHILFTRRIHTL